MPVFYEAISVQRERISVGAETYDPFAEMFPTDVCLFNASLSLRWNLISLSPRGSPYFGLF